MTVHDPPVLGRLRAVVHAFRRLNTVSGRDMPVIRDSPDQNPCTTPQPHRDGAASPRSAGEEHSLRMGFVNAGTSNEGGLYSETGRLQLVPNRGWVMQVRHQVDVVPVRLLHFPAAASGLQAEQQETSSAEDPPALGDDRREIIGGRVDDGVPAKDSVDRIVRQWQVGQGADHEAVSWMQGASCAHHHRRQVDPEVVEPPR